MSEASDAASTSSSPARSEDDAPARGGREDAHTREHTDRADRVQDRLAVPVLIAALASVPAIFLTLLDDPWQAVGEGVNTASGAVLVLETVILLALAEDRRAWIARNRWLIALTVVIIPAVIFAVGPVQLLRLVRVVGAVRIIRVGRILKAGRILRDRYGINRWWERAIGFTVTVLVAAFVAVVLADDTSTTRELLDPVIEASGIPGWLLAVVAGAIIAGATFVVARNRDGPSPDHAEGSGECDRSDQSTSGDASG